MARPTTHPIKKVLGLTADLAERIRDYRFRERIDSENEAIRQLIEAGLRAGAPIPIKNPKLGGGSTGGGEPGGSDGSGKQSSAKTLRPRKTVPAKPISKEAQLRALREQAAR